MQKVPSARRRKRFLKIGPGVLLVLLWITAATTPSWAQDVPRKQVLVLHSYHRGYKWTDDITDGILASLDPATRGIDVQIEYMDTKRIYDETYVQQLYEIYKYKFRNRRFDAIISSDDNALNFLLAHHDDLFPGTPVVFSGVNYFDPSLRQQYDFITGVNEEADLGGTLDLALTLQPGTKQVLVVNDMTTTGRKMHDELTKLLPAYQDRVQFIWLEDVDMAEVQRVIGTMPSNTVVLYTLFFRDKAGTFYEYDASVRQVVAHSQVPVYGTWDFSLGYGIIGGMLTSGYYQGETAGQLALRVLQGESVQDIPVVMESPNRFMFDYEQLQRFGIALSQLPADSIVINQPVSFYSQYKGWIWGGAATLLALMVVVLVLASLNIRRARAEGALRQSNEELQAIRESLEDRVARRTATLDRRRSQLEAAAHVAREAAAIRDADLLLAETVQLISERMGFYHAGVFLLDEQKHYAVLRAASSAGGQRMLAHGHRLRVGQEGIVGFVANSGQPRIALDVGEDAVFFDNPDLPLTRSEMGLPLLVREQIIGVLDVQTTEALAFSEEDIAILQTLADQVSLALDNARLLEETEDRLREIAALSGEREKQAWQQIAADRPSWGYTFDGVSTMPHDGSRPAGGSAQLQVPIRIQEETIGYVNLDLGEGAPTAAEDVVARTIADRAGQALERARLYTDIQRREARERTIREIADQMQRASDMEALMRITTEELNRRLGGSRTYVRLSTGTELVLDDNGHGHQVQDRSEGRSHE